MRIFIPEDGRYEGAKLSVGRYYTVEDATSGTEAQNRFFHKLLQIYFKSGAYSYDVKNPEDLKSKIKEVYGAGFDSWTAVRPGIGRVMYRTFDTLEKAENSAFVIDGVSLIVPNLKSWSRYTLAERRKTIDGLISEMVTAGVNGKEFDEIMGSFTWN